MHTLHLLLFVSCCLVESTISFKSTMCPELQPRGANVSVGVVIDGSSRIGKEQKIAMKMAAKDLSHCLNLDLHIKDLHGNSALAASAALNLINHKHVDTIIGTLTVEQATVLSHSHLKTPPPIISLSPAASPPPQPPPSFNQMTLPAAHQIRCIASLIAHFHWKNLISISQDPTLFLPLSRALNALDISIDLHATAPVPHASIESELKKMIGATNSRVFVVMHCSLEFAAILFEKAWVLGLMEKGLVWIVADEISNLLDSADSSLLLNMEGVLAIKSDYSTNHNNFKVFKSKFRRKYESCFPSEENPTPSI